MERIKDEEKTDQYDELSVVRGLQVAMLFSSKISYIKVYSPKDFFRILIMCNSKCTYHWWIYVIIIITIITSISKAFMYIVPTYELLC